MGKHYMIYKNQILARSFPAGSYMFKVNNRDTRAR